MGQGEVLWQGEQAQHTVVVRVNETSRALILLLRENVKRMKIGRHQQVPLVAHEQTDNLDLGIILKYISFISFREMF